MQCVNNLKQIGVALHNYHNVVRFVPDGVVEELAANQCLQRRAWTRAPTAQMLGFLGEVPLYNAINFCFGLATAQNPAGPVQSTVYNSRVNEFLCPSDANAGQTYLNSYDDCFGTTTTTSTVQTTTGSTGLFTFWQSYGSRDCTDGLSNTAAFSESLVGTGVAQFTPVRGAHQRQHPGDGRGPRRHDEPGRRRGGVDGLQHVLEQSLDRATSARFAATSGCTAGRRIRCSTPSPRPTPSSIPGPIALLGGVNTDGEFTKANSNHPGGVNTLMGDGSRPVRQGFDQPDHLVVPGHRRARGEDAY